MSALILRPGAQLGRQVTRIVRDAEVIRMDAEALLRAIIEPRVALVRVAEVVTIDEEGHPAALVLLPSGEPAWLPEWALGEAAEAAYVFVERPTFALAANVQQHWIECEAPGDARWELTGRDEEYVYLRASGPALLDTSLHRALPEDVGICGEDGEVRELVPREEIAVAEEIETEAWERFGAAFFGDDEGAAAIRSAERWGMVLDAETQPVAEEGSPGMQRVSEAGSTVLAAAEDAATLGPGDTDASTTPATRLAEEVTRESDPAIGARPAGDRVQRRAEPRVTTQERAIDGDPMAAHGLARSRRVSQEPSPSRSPARLEARPEGRDSEGSTATPPHARPAAPISRTAPARDFAVDRLARPLHIAPPTQEARRSGAAEDHGGERSRDVPTASARPSSHPDGRWATRPSVEEHTRLVEEPLDAPAPGESSRTRRSSEMTTSPSITPRVNVRDTSPPAIARLAARARTPAQPLGPRALDRGVEPPTQIPLLPPQPTTERPRSRRDVAFVASARTIELGPIELTFGALPAPSTGERPRGDRTVAHATRTPTGSLLAEIPPSRGWRGLL